MNLLRFNIEIRRLKETKQRRVPLESLMELFGDLQAWTWFAAKTIFLLKMSL